MKQIPLYLLKQELPWVGDSVSRWDKKKSMPFIVGPAIGLASASIGAAVVAGTAATIASAAVATIGAIGAIATVAGLALTVVGYATGNKELQHVGMIVGIAGGVAGLGSLALNAGLSATSEGFAAASAANTAAAASAGADTALGGLTNAGAAYDAGAASALSAQSVPLSATSGLGGATSLALKAPIEQPIQAIDMAGNAVKTATTGAVDAVKTVGANVGNTATLDGLTSSIKDLSVQVGKGTGVDKAFSMKDTLLPIGTIGAGIFQSNAADKASQNSLVTAQNTLAYNKSITDRQNANANVQGNLNLSVAPWTPSATIAQQNTQQQLDANGNVIIPKGLLAK